MEQYENCYNLNEYLFRDNFYQALVWVITDIDERIVDDFGWNISKLELYNNDFSELQFLIVNPEFTVLNIREQNYIDNLFHHDYGQWLLGRYDEDWYHELHLGDFS